MTTAPVFEVLGSSVVVFRSEIDAAVEITAFGPSVAPCTRISQGFSTAPHVYADPNVSSDGARATSPINAMLPRPGLSTQQRPIGRNNGVRDRACAR